MYSSKAAEMLRATQLMSAENSFQRISESMILHAKQVWSSLECFILFRNDEADQQLLEQKDLCCFTCGYRVRVSEYLIFLMIVKITLVINISESNAFLKLYPTVE